MAGLYRRKRQGAAGPNAAAESAEASAAATDATEFDATEFDATEFEEAVFGADPSSTGANGTDTDADGADAAEPTDDVTTADDTPPATEPRKSKKGRRTGWSGTRLVALLAAVAVVSLLAGVAVMQFVVSPAELAARTAAPEPGPVTASIEQRIIENTVVTRGEVTYADAVSVSIDAGGERPVVTGHVPTVGAVLDVGNIAIEIAGRPVIVLPGELPAYRSLSVGMRGPDVQQLKSGLNGMGFWAGDPASDVFDYDTAAAIGALYQQVGYEPANGGAEAQQALRGAERGVRDAENSRAQAAAALEEARRGESTNLIAEEGMLASAQDAVNDAYEFLGAAQEAVMPTLPSSEVLFLSNLPRRVDDVSVKRGDILSGSPMSVSGAALTIVGTISEQDMNLLAEGLTATFPGPDGADLTAQVQTITAPSRSSGEGDQGGGRYTVTLVPQELTAEQIDALRGTNVRLRIPVASTDGEVLAVPIAALSAGSGGEDRVELLIDIKSGQDAETEIITVTAGLAADGFVEITSDDARVTAGARVVVGR